MIQFFRRIRQQLLTKNKFSKYLLYAIGEIILVVIGILIALQINNWNENRKLRGIEIETLKELRSDLSQSLHDITSDQEYFQYCKKSTTYILEHFKNEAADSDSLNFHFWNMYPFSTFSINRTTFDNLRQSGSNIITNDSLRVKLADLYTRSINLYKELEKRAVIFHDEQFITPMKMSEFKSFSRNNLILKDYEAFFGNTYNQQVLNRSIFIFNNLIEYQNYLIKDVELLIDQIDEEVGHR